MIEDSEKTRRTELTLGERRLYDLSSIAKPIGKPQESSRPVVVDECGTIMTLAAEADESLLSEDRIVVAPAAYRELPSVVAAQQTMPRRRFMIDATVDIARRLRERPC
jgi:hypothetical protein